MKWPQNPLSPRCFSHSDLLFRTALSAKSKTVTCIISNLEFIKHLPDFEPLTSMARIGKIARLPRPVRNELNRRLDNGEFCAAIVERLNGLDEVQRALGIAHGGRPITEQNLSDWRNNGFQDWKRNQDACDWASQLACRAGHIADEAGLMPLSESVASIATLALGKRLQEITEAPLSDQTTREEFLVLLKELTRIRQTDRKSARLRMSLVTFEKDHGSAESP
jgi:hypothetical protein